MVDAHADRAVAAVERSRQREEMSVFGLMPSRSYDLGALDDCVPAAVVVVVVVAAAAAAAAVAAVAVSIGATLVVPMTIHL